MKRDDYTEAAARIYQRAIERAKVQYKATVEQAQRDMNHARNEYESALINAHHQYSRFVLGVHPNEDPNYCSTCGSDRCISFRGADCPAMEEMSDELEKIAREEYEKIVQNGPTHDEEVQAYEQAMNEAAERQAGNDEIPF